MTIQERKTVPRFIVAQTGSRRGYAIPYLLHQAGMLTRFYTDVVGNSGWGRYFTLGTKLPWFGSKLKLLANRRLPDSIVHKTTTFFLPSLIRALKDTFLSRDPKSRIENNLDWNQRLGKAAISLGYSDATHLYTMLNDFSPLLSDARKHGLTVVSETYIALSAVHLVCAEHEQFPDWEPERAGEQLAFRELLEKMNPVEDVDFFICPSEFVAQDLIEHWGVSPSAIHVVPYGVNPTWLSVASHPVEGRILFVGTAELRKGIHYLAMASQELKRRGRTYEFRIAGSVEQSVKEHPMCRGLSFLGRVPLANIQSEYEQADIFVLPSIAEGSAEVVYEALASSLPVVTTAEAGSIVEDGKEGLIIPKKNFLALADAIENLVENRGLREQLSIAARHKAKSYTWDKYGDRLLETFRNLPRTKSQ